jgi:sulfur-oxidizing protein SoxX
MNMRKFASAFVTAGMLLGSALCGTSAVAKEMSLQERIAEGKKIAWNRSKGNCLACHIMEDGEFPGNTAPPLMMMKQRYPDKTQLRAQIWDPRVRNPYAFMPPFGAHRILSEEEIDLVTDYVYSL